MQSGRREYSAEEMREKLRGFIIVPAEMWDHIPKSSYVRYLERGPAPTHQRFRAGGWLQEHCIRQGDRGISMSSAYRGGPGASDYFAPYSEIECIWKRIAPASIIEFIIMDRAVAEMKAEVAKLSAEVRRLTPQ